MKQRKTGRQNKQINTGDKIEAKIEKQNEVEKDWQIK